MRRLVIEIKHDDVGRILASLAVGLRVIATLNRDLVPSSA
jgi:hypothetical protein